MLRREASQLFGPRLADALGASPDPSCIAPALVTLWARMSQSSDGEELETSWTQFFDVLRERRPFRGAYYHPGWSPCALAPSVRAPANVRAVSALLMRFGRGSGARLSQAQNAFDGVHGLIVTTHRHSRAVPDFVAVLPYSRLVSSAEHRKLAVWAMKRAAARGLPRGHSAPNGAGFTFLTGVIPGAPFEVVELRGDALHVDAILGEPLPLERQ